jgi:hypothetical protein
MRSWMTGLVLAAALSLGAGMAQAVPCPPSAELIFSDTVVVRGVVTEVAWQSEGTRQVQYFGTTEAVPVTVQIWRATIDVTSVLRGEGPQNALTYDFQTPLTGCEGAAVAVGDHLLMAIDPRGVATIQSEAALTWASGRRLSERPSQRQSSAQDSEKQ